MNNKLEQKLEQKPEINPRPVNKVIDTVIKIIPKNETLLLEELRNYKKELVYSAPELLISDYRWGPFLDILNYHIKTTSLDWHYQIAKIVNNSE